MRSLPVILTASASALVLAGCGSGSAGAGEDGGEVTVVTSTNVYASLAEAVAGDAAEVTPIISDPAQDPHEYEASARDQLALSKADLVVMNGGGYDSYMSTMLEAIDGDPEVIDAVGISGLPGSEDASAHSHDHGHGDEGEPVEGEETAEGEDGHEGHGHGEEGHEGHDHAEAGQDHEGHDHAEDAHEGHGHEGHDHAEDAHEGHDHAEDGHEGHDHGAFNEHVWYSVPTMLAVVDEVEAHLAELSPDDAEAFASNAETIRGELDEMNARLGDIREAHEGEKAAVTEPVALWLFEDMGLENVVPEEFVYAVEAGADVSPIVLRDATTALEDEDVAVLAYNTQTSGPEAETLRETAEELSIPVVELSETTAADQSYSEWMSANIDALEQALS
ncbi:metal ABC transporter substrate-binding protein [Brevibacterium album]|uniref:metal ABC transporter substrate-binding protein n=1 Tax=Brevibacterium album TaxID=417948 RepID=UPI00048E65C9|nr:zinc ABC transporter substrate-binding protein [Brevibacterium album]